MPNKLQQLQADLKKLKEERDKLGKECVDLENKIYEEQQKKAQSLYNPPKGIEVNTLSDGALLLTRKSRSSAGATIDLSSFSKKIKLIKLKNLRINLVCSKPNRSLNILMADDCIIHNLDLGNLLSLRSLRFFHNSVQKVKSLPKLILSSSISIDKEECK